MKEKEKAGSKSDNILKYLKLIREPKGDVRKQICCRLFEELYNKKFSILQMDAFLIKVVHEIFGEFTADTDIVLMALGLMEGYDYNDEPKIGERRAKYLRESKHLQHEKTPRDDISPNVTDTDKDNLRKTEDVKFQYLAYYWDQMNKKVNIDEFMKESNDYIHKVDYKSKVYGVSILDLPIPGYIIRESYRKQKNFNRKGIENSLVDAIKISIFVFITSSLSFVLLSQFSYFPRSDETNHIHEANSTYDIREEKDGGKWIEAEPQVSEHAKTNEPTRDESESDNLDSDEDPKSLF